MRKKKGGKDKLPSFVPVFREMLKSHAWETIGNPARVAYIHIKSKCHSSEPVDITLSYNEMERVMTRRAYKRALDELEQQGFITITQRGGLYRRRNFYMLSEGWRSVKT